MIMVTTLDWRTSTMRRPAALLTLLVESMGRDVNGDGRITPDRNTDLISELAAVLQ